MPPVQVRITAAYEVIGNLGWPDSSAGLTVPLMASAPAPFLLGQVYPTAPHDRVAARRGGAALWAENSLLAFRNALGLDSDLIEFDVHLTADGALAVIHDPTLDRTTSASGPVAAHTAADLGRARLRGPDGALTDERVPLLDEVLALVAPSRAGLLVEVKGPVAGVGVRYQRRGGRRAAGLLLGVWTVNAERAMRRLVELGVDVLTTDHPDVAKRVLGRAS